MEFNLRALKRYRRRQARRSNNFRKFILENDRIIIEPDLFRLSESPSIYFANSRRAYRKALRTENHFIYFRKKGLLLFNQNGRARKLGKGGIVALFPKKLPLDDSSFEITNSFYEGSELTPISKTNPRPNPAPAPTPAPIPVPELAPTPVPTSGPEPVPASGSTYDAVLRNGASEVGKIDYRGEKDLFLLDVPSGYEVSVNVSGETYPVVNIVNSAGDVLIEGSWSKPTSYVKAGDPIYAQVYGYGGHQGTYDIQLYAEKYMTEQQKMQIAPMISESASYEGDIAKAGQQDYFKLSVKSDSIVSISLDSDSGLYPLLDVVDESGEIISEVSKHNGYGSSFYNLKLFEFPSSPDALYLRVKSQGSSYTGKYNIASQIDAKSDFKDEVIRLTNAERKKYGLEALSYDPILEAAAQAHVDDMDASGRYLAHTGSNGSSAKDRIKLAGYKAAWHVSDDGSKMYPSQENAASGQTSPAEVVEGWMTSPGHRAAMLTPETKEIGVGFQIDDESGTSYWIQNFGIPWSDGDQRYF